MVAFVERTLNHRKHYFDKQLEVDIALLVDIHWAWVDTYSVD